MNRSLSTERRAGENVFLVGALSYEERCVGALAALSRRDRELQGVFLDYGTTATPGATATTRRQTNWEKIEDITRSQTDWVCHRSSSNPYAMDDLAQVLDDAAKLERGRLVVDVTCMTKPHLLAAASWLAVHPEVSWTLAYATPKNYGDVQRSIDSGVQATLTLPLGPHPSLRNQGLSLGLFILGAEAGRAAIALEELEPSAGLIVLVTRSDRADFEANTLAQNDQLVSYLSSLVLAGPRVVDSGFAQIWPSKGWEFREFRNETLVSDTYNHLVNELIPAAELLDSPIVLYPFGPKDAVFMASFVLARLYPHASWSIYPVLDTHPLDYSEGLHGLRWLSSEEVNSV
ncbi:hypothetical protein GCM10009641_87360 [Mycobacterium cookii]|uniref:Uncharacterized protein n=1 Tax=Nocardioides furvisabuli TaxID=375542 RepID=A0ABP5I5H9_9ACTN|nr:hypothetical protein [Nocardioides furvisabuli]